MLGKSMIALIGLALCAPTAEAAEHRDGPHHPALMIPLPGNFTPPHPPEDSSLPLDFFFCRCSLNPSGLLKLVGALN